VFLQKLCISSGCVCSMHYEILNNMFNIDVAMCDIMLSGGRSYDYSDDDRHSTLRHTPVMLTPTLHEPRKHTTAILLLYRLQSWRYSYHFWQANHSRFCWLSDVMLILFSIPQGSNIGSMLFILHMQIMHCWVTLAYFIIQNFSFDLVLRK